jgi:hypothetical protein
MANYYKVAASAVAELFDGSQAGAEALILAYPDIVSIQQGDTYPELVGTVEVDVGDTLAEVSTEITKEDLSSPYEIVFTVDTAPTVAGDLTIEFFEEDPIVVAVLETDDALETAAKIAAATFPGFTAVDNMDGTVTVTEDALDNVILSVLDENGLILNAYKDSYIAFIDEMSKASFEVSKTEVWPKAMFEKYFIEIEA